MKKMLIAVTFVASAGLSVGTTTTANGVEPVHSNNGCYVKHAMELGLNPSVTAHGQTELGPGTGSGKIPGGFVGVAYTTC